MRLTNLCSLAALCLLTACATTPKRPSGPNPLVGPAHVTAVQGSAEYTPDGLAWQPVAAGQELKAGARIRTTDDGVVMLQINRMPPVITVQPDSEVKVVHFADDTHLARVELVSGDIMVDDKDIPGAARLEIKTRTGTITVPK